MKTTVALMACFLIACGPSAVKTDGGGDDDDAGPVQRQRVAVVQRW